MCYSMHNIVVQYRDRITESEKTEVKSRRIMNKNPWKLSGFHDRCVLVLSLSLRPLTIEYVCVFGLKCFCFENSNFRIMDPVEIVAFGRFLFHNALGFWKMTRIENESIHRPKIQNESRKKTNRKNPTHAQVEKCHFQFRAFWFTFWFSIHLRLFLSCAPTLLAYATPLKGCQTMRLFSEILCVCVLSMLALLLFCALYLPTPYGEYWNEMQSVGAKKERKREGKMNISKMHKHWNMAWT